MKDKLIQIANYALDRLKEQSTWQGIGFIVSLTGSKIGLGMDWGQCAGVAGSVTAAIKMLLPDAKGGA